MAFTNTSFIVFRLNSEYTFDFPVEETTGKSITIPNVRVDFTITDEDGVDITDKASIEEVSLPVGFFSNYSWIIGDISGGDSLLGNFKFIVNSSDVKYAKITGIITTSASGESDSSDNTRYEILEGISQDALLSGGVVLLDPNTTYDDDTDALAGGLNMYEYYILSATNTYSLPEGIIKQITNVSPAYVPSYTPSYVTPSYTPIYTTPSYAPSYVPTYTTPTYTPIP